MVEQFYFCRARLEYDAAASPSDTNLGYFTTQFKSLRKAIIFAPKNNRSRKRNVGCFGRVRVLRFVLSEAQWLRETDQQQ
jgi:hypothetical protein